MSDKNGEYLYKWGKREELIIDTKKDLKEKEQSEEKLYSEADGTETILKNSSEDDLLTKNQIRLENLNQKISENMNEKLPFLIYQQLLNQGDYTYKASGRDKNATKTRHSNLMTNILNSMQELDGLLSKKIESEPKALEETGNKIQEAMLTICKNCEIYLEKRNPWSAEGKARKQMVEYFYKEVSYESQSFAGMLKKAGTDKERMSKYKSWNAFLADVRTEVYINGEDGVKINKGGAGTSELYIIEKNGVKTFFKESESLPTEVGYDEFLSKEIKACDNTNGSDNDTNTKQKELLTFLQTNLNDCFKDFDARDKYDLVVVRPILNRLNPKQYMNYIIKDVMDCQGEFDELIRTHEIGEKDLLLFQAKMQEMEKAFNLSKLAIDTAKIKAGSNISKRNVATSRMAKLLGISDLIVETKNVEINVDGKVMRGIMMADAQGSSVWSINKKYKGFHHNNIKFSGDAIQQFSSLQIFDVICGQIDRNGGNYLAKTDSNNKNVNTITGIDNDLAFGNLSYDDIYDRGYKGYHEIKNLHFGEDSLLCGVDEDLANKILALTPEYIDYMMCDLLSKEERHYLMDRIVGVQDYINLLKKKDEKIKDNTKKWIRPKGSDWGKLVDRQKKINKNVAKTADEEMFEFSGNCSYIPQFAL
ncbi:MAG: hypothetical protein K6F00_08390 [Lachnospiraceae bacterium]|nr:hypothetical protein [Lachnospiraceae bacterium]